MSFSPISPHQTALAGDILFEKRMNQINVTDQLIDYLIHVSAWRRVTPDGTWIDLLQPSTDYRELLETTRLLGQRVDIINTLKGMLLDFAFDTNIWSLPERVDLTNRWLSHHFDEQRPIHRRAIQAAADSLQDLLLELHELILSFVDFVPIPLVTQNLNLLK